MDDGFKDRVIKAVGALVLAMLVIVASALGINLPIPNIGGSGGQTLDADDACGWSEAEAPNYFLVTGRADLEEDTMRLEEGTYETRTDELGRPSLVIAKVDADMRTQGAERERGRLPNPMGWPKNAEVEIEFADGTVYHGWLFNRSHLLAKSLGGPDTKDNLVTGTRPQNVGNNDEDGGMGHTESEARAWLDQHPDGYVLYEVEPVYQGDEPIPRTVDVDIRTSDGAIDEHVVTYNAAKGYSIDYATGQWKRKSGSFAAKLTSAATPVAEGDDREKES